MAKALVVEKEDLQRQYACSVWCDAAPIRLTYSGVNAAIEKVHVPGGHYCARLLTAEDAILFLLDSIEAYDPKLCDAFLRRIDAPTSVWVRQQPWERVVHAIMQLAAHLPGVAK
jgi:hypothetical protein